MCNISKYCFRFRIGYRKPAEKPEPERKHIVSHLTIYKNGCHLVCLFAGLKFECVLGGDAMEKQFAAIHENPDVIFATPGRFVHLCLEMGLKLASVEYVVFDEADRLFEMGLGEQLREILARLPDTR